MARIFLDEENKIVVEADKGIVNPDGTTEVELTEKEYTINGDDLAVLLNIVNKRNVEIREFSIKGFFTITRLLSNEDMKDELEKISNMNDELKKKIENLIEKNNNLEFAIKEHNENRKIFWKPIKIDYGNKKNYLCRKRYIINAT